MTLRLRLFASALALALASTAVTSQAAPPESGQDEGRTRFQRGIELYKEGNYHAALAEFRAANAAAPSSRIQYNLGQTLFQLQDYAGALAAFEAYIAEGRDKIPEDRLREVDADLVKLRQRVAILKLVVVNAEGTTPAGINVTVDDEARALGPVAAGGTLRVSAGRRKVAVTASGYQTETRALDVAGSSVVELRFELKPIAAGNAEARAVVRTEPSYAPAGGSSRSRVPVYLGIGATALLGATAVTFGVLAGNKHSAYDDAKATPDPDRAALDDLRGSTKTFALLADIFTGTAIVAGVTTIVLVFTTGGSDSRTAAQRGPGFTLAGVQVQPLVGPGSAGLHATF